MKEVLFDVPAPHVALVTIARQEARNAVNGAGAELGWTVEVRARNSGRA